MKNNRVFFSFLLLTFLGVFLWSSNAPRDRFTWYLEAAPAIIALTLLLLTYRLFAFTRLAYALMWAHAIILLIGAHYTYAEVPPFNWLRDALALSRNHFDRLGHLGSRFRPRHRDSGNLAAQDALAPRENALLPGDLSLPGR